MAVSSVATGRKFSSQELISDILSPSLGKLEFEANAHLFQWPGNLVEDGGAPIATQSPDTIPEKSLDEFGYRGDRFSSAPYPDRNYKQPKAPLETWDQIIELRDRLNAPEKEKAIVDGFARPSSAVAFDLRQQETDYLSPNPLLEKWQVASFSQNFYGDPELSDEFSLQGSEWALSQLSLAGLEVEHLIKESLITKLTLDVSIRVLVLHMLHHQPHSKAEAIATHFLDVEIARHGEALEGKLQRIRQQQYRFIAAGSTPILNADGSQNAALTLCNVAAALVAIQGLEQLATRLFSFHSGAKYVAEKVLGAIAARG